MAVKSDEQVYLASQWSLMWRKFRRHKLAMFGLVLLVILYIQAFFCGFFAVNDINTTDVKYSYMPPQKVHFIDHEGRFHLRPFVYGIRQTKDLETFTILYEEVTDEVFPIRFFMPGDEYRFWGIFRAKIHFIGVESPGRLFLFGTDKLGRDLFSRTLYAGRVSLSVGFVGVAFSFVLGTVLGGLSGFYGGKVDLVIQRLIEVLLSIPTIPLWMALSAALPPQWPPVKVYFGVTIVLSFIGWCGLARIVRGKLLELREEDFVIAAQVAGAGDWQIISRHLLPSFLSFFIVHLSLSIPTMIMGETALSFLGLGIRPPAVSWGALLKDAQNARTIILYPWIMIPGLFVIVTVLAFNFLGDGLRDAADPYKQ